MGLSSDATRLEIERLEVQYSEKLNQHQTRYNIELSSLREQLQESESHRELLQREVNHLFLCLFIFQTESGLMKDFDISISTNCVFKKI